MGITISVAVDPTCISKTAWQRVYDETVTILRAWPDPPIRPGYREVAGVEIVAYTRNVVQPDGWHICGDANSRLTAESIELSRELGVDDPRDPPSDLPLRILASWEPPYDGQGLHWLLNRKTQGRPFHSLVLAIAMLIEHRLPHAAFATGDFTPDEARAAQSQLRTILGETIPLPMCTRPERLRERLRPHVQDHDLDDAVESLSCRGSLAGILIGLLNGSLGSPGSHNRQEIERAVACTDVSTLDELTREAFEFLMGQCKALFGHEEPDDAAPDDAEPEDPSEPTPFPAELAELDAHRLLEIIARGTEKTYLRLTEMAWDDIERASLPELRMLAMLATHPTTGLVAHQLRRAVFESVAVRRFSLEAWNTTDPVPPLDYPIQARLFDEGWCAP